MRIRAIFRLFYSFFYKLNFFHFITTTMHLQISIREWLAEGWRIDTGKYAKKLHRPAESELVKFFLIG